MGPAPRIRSVALSIPSDSAVRKSPSSRKERARSAKTHAARAPIRPVAVSTAVCPERVCTENENACRIPVSASAISATARIRSCDRMAIERDSALQREPELQGPTPALESRFRNTEKPPPTDSVMAASPLSR